MKLSALLDYPAFRIAVFAIVVLAAARLFHRLPGPAPEPMPPMAAEDEAALVLRQQAFAAVRTTATLLVYPVRLDGRLDSESAGLLAEKLAAAHVGSICGIAPPLVPAGLPEHLATSGPVLARALSAHLTAQPSDADYVLYAIYTLRPDGWEKGSAEFALCEGRGRLVFSERLDARRGDFRVVRPVSKEDCTELVVRRLRERFAPDAAAPAAVAAHVPSP